MSGASLSTTDSRRRPWLSLLIYMALLVGLSAIAISAMSALLESRAALEGSRDTLARLDRQMRLAAPHEEANAAFNGPPFLIGKTITIGGAALQARVEAAVKEAGGVVLSSQIDLQGPQAAEGFISLTESLEINQASLQTFLYDLEAGMPYIFIENLAIQAPQAVGEAEAAPMRVLIVVSGQWRDAQ